MPRAETGSGARRRRSSASITVRAASTSRRSRPHRRREPRGGVGRAADHSLQSACDARAAAAPGDRSRAKRMRLGGLRTDTCGELAVEPRTLPPDDRE